MFKTPPGQPRSLAYSFVFCFGSNLPRFKIKASLIGVNKMEKIVSEIKNPLIRCKKKSIGRNCKIGRNVKIVCDTLMLRDDVIIENDADVYLHGKLEIGNLSTLGPNTIMRGNNVSIGSEFFSDGKLEIGGGGWTNPKANLVIGDKCVMHNNHININSPITIGNHVGLSPNVALITHGYWQSTLKGFPFREGPIVIKDNVIIGRNSLVLANVTIGESAVIGAGSVVTKDVGSYHVMGGVPARTLYIVKPNSLIRDKKEGIARQMIEEYKESLSFRNNKLARNVKISLDYPIVRVNNAIFDLEKEEYDIKRHTAITDDFRDFVRRKGIWFYGRRFRSIKKKVV